MLNTEEVNKILIKYSSLIDDSISKTSVDYKLLRSRCVTIDDLKQEVYIKLWERLENYYDDKYDLERFISFHASFHAKYIMSNLRRSSSGFVGSMDPNRKSAQAKIDNRKSSLDEIIDWTLRKSDYSDVLKDESFGRYLGPHNIGLFDNSYLTFGECLDYEYLITEIKKRLLNQEKENKNYNQIYLDIFEFIIANYNLLYDKTTLQLIIADKFNYKTRGGVRYILNKIKQIMFDVISEYMRE